MVTKDHMVSLIAHLIKNLPAMQETWVQFLGWEDPPEKEMAIHSSILPGKSYGQRSLAGYSPWGHKSQTAELLWEKCSQTLKIKLQFYGNALDPVNGPLFGAVPFEESLLTGCLHTH